MARARIGFGMVMLLGVVTLSLAHAGDKDKDNDKDKDRRPSNPPNVASTIHGENFQIRSQLDNNFCVAVGAGTQEGRTLNLTQCAAVETQRFDFTWNADDTNIIVESQGMCIDARNRKGGDGLAVPVQKCKFGDAWRFAVLATGQIQDQRNNKCLSIPGAAANAAVSLVDCDSTKKNQLFKFTK